MKLKKTVSALLALLMAVTASALCVPAYAAEAAETAPDEDVYVLMNIPYADFYANEGAVDAITSATRNGKARNVNVNGASYHRSEDAVKAEGIAGCTYPVKATAAILTALAEKGAQAVTDSAEISYEMSARGNVTQVTLKGAETLQEAPDYSYYVLSEAPAAYKEITLSDGKITFGPFVGTAETGNLDGEITVGAKHADIEIKLSGEDMETLDPKSVSAVVITTSAGASYALHHVTNIWRGTEIGWNLSDLDLGGESVTCVRYYRKDGTVKDYATELAIAKAGYVLMNIPYGEFYRAEAAENTPAVDAVTSATKTKPRTGSLAGGSYHANADGSDISGVVYPVFVTDMSLLDGYTKITDDYAVDITVTNRGKTTTTTYAGKDGLFEAPSHAWYLLSEKPARYKKLSADGSFSAVSGRASSVEGVAAEVTYGARHKNIEIKLTGTEGIEAGDPISGIVLTLSDGTTAALRHVANIWRGTEIGWDYDEFDLLGKTITNIRYITQTGVIDYPVEIVLKNDASGLTAAFTDKKSVTLSDMPADIQNPAVSVYYVEGEGREAKNVYLAENVPVKDGKAALATAAENGKTYQFTVTSDNYIPLKAEVEFKAKSFQSPFGRFMWWFGGAFAGGK